MTRERPGAWADASPTTSLGPQQTKPRYERDMGYYYTSVALIYISLTASQESRLRFSLSIPFYSQHSILTAWWDRQSMLATVICYHALSSHIAKASRTRANMSTRRLGLPFGLPTLLRVLFTLLSDCCDIPCCAILHAESPGHQDFCPDSTVPSQGQAHCTSTRAEAFTMISYCSWSLKVSLLTAVLPMANGRILVPCLSVQVYQSLGH